MNISSVSSSSVWWEEYLEKQRKLQQQASENAIPAAAVANEAAAGVPETAPEEILAELQALRDDPEKLKAKAAELAVQTANEAERVGGVSAGALRELASDLEAVAEDGNLSVIEEKIARAAGAKSGARPSGPSGMSGGTGASIKWIEALVEEEDDELSFAEALEEYLEELEAGKAAAESAGGSAESAAAELKTGFTNNKLLSFYNRPEQYSHFSLTA